MATEGIEGLAAFKDRLENLSQSMQKTILTKAARAGGEVIRREAERRAPRLKVPDPRRTPGLLAKSEMLKVVKRSAGRAVVTIGPSTDAWYARFVEFGTMYQKAQPFLRPALDESQDAVMRAIEEVFQQAIEQGVR